MLALKQNQRNLRVEAEQTFAGVVPGYEAWDWAAGNVPVRWQVSVQTDLRWVDEAGRWPQLAALVRVETLRCPPDALAVTQPVRYYLSSQCPRTAAQAQAAVCGHWAIENQMHWHLDVTLGEDAHQLRDQQAAENLALVRKMALNLLRADPEPGSLKIKRKRLGWDNAYLGRLLAHLTECV